MRQRAFSLPELLAALAILSILAALALPSWQRGLGRAAVDAAVRQALAGLALARRTALTTGNTLTLCPTDNLTDCRLDGHEWMLFANTIGGVSSRREPAEALLQRWPLPAGVRITGTRSHVWYLPQTRAAAATTWEFCHPAAPAVRRQVIVSQTGRPRLSSAAPTSSPPPSPCP